MEEGVTLTLPEPLDDDHKRSRLDCDDERMNRWLRERGLRSEGRTSRTYVVRDADGSVAGYYSLAAGSLSHVDAPDPIPIIVLGRLAVDLRYQRLGIGSALLFDAMRRTVAAGRVVGVRGMLVHVLTPDALDFYLRLGFVRTPVKETVAMPIEAIEQALLDR